MEYLFGVLVLLVFGVVTWCVASEGAWGAGLIFLCVLFAGLLAMNFFEPVAAFLDHQGGEWVQNYSDLAALVGLFALFTFLARSAAEHLAPTDLELDGRIYQFARWVFAVATGYTTTAILLTALHTAPLPREFIGFKPEGKNLFDMRAPDREWLGLVQHISERVLRTGRTFDGGIPPDLAGSDPSHWPQTSWPAYPIRYATRREDLASGRGSQAPAGSTSPAPATSGTGSGGSGKAAF
ncbi:MAG: CvpA family protein [Planctomycetaceae bacterium]